MCIPLITAATALTSTAGATTGTASLFSGLLGAASAGLGLYGQIQTAKAQEDYQQRLAAQRNEQMVKNAELATKAYNQNVQMMNIRRQQEAAASEREKINIQREALRRQSTAGLAAGESGAAGVSLSMLYDDFSRSQAEYTAMIDREESMKQQQYDYQNLAFQQETQARIDSVTPFVAQPIAQPDYFGAIAGAGSSLYGGYADYMEKTSQGVFASDPEKAKEGPSIFGAYKRVFTGYNTTG